MSRLIQNRIAFQEMPGSESLQVKCELPSEDDESNSEFVHSFAHQVRLSIFIILATD